MSRFGQLLEKYLPRSVASSYGGGEEKFSAREDLLAITKFKVIFYTSLVWAGVILSLSILRVWHLGEFGNDSLGLFLFGGSFIGLTVYLAQTGKVAVSALTLNGLLFLFIPFRAFMTGGVDSPAVALYSAHCILAFTLIGRGAGLRVFAWSLLSVFAFSALGDYYHFPQEPFFESPIILGITVILFSSMILMPALFIFQEKDWMTDKLKELEKNSTSHLLMEKLVRETKESLSSAKSELDGVFANRSFEKVGSVENSLRKVDYTVKQFTKISDETKRRALEAENEARSIFKKPRKNLKAFLRFLFLKTTRKE